MSTAPFPITPHLMAIAIAYRNQRYIADEILPRVPVSKKEFEYWLYPKEETFARPDTKVGRKSAPNQIDLSATKLPAVCEDFGLDDLIPNDDINNAPANYDPKGRAVATLGDYIMLDREMRVAALVQAAAQYAASNKVTLSGTSKFSDVTSDPIGIMTDGLDACLIRPNIATFARTSWSVFARHPKIVKAVNGNAGDSGIARKAQIAELFELDDILIGEGRINTAKKGQAATLARVWNNNIVLSYRNTNADTSNDVTFGYTAQCGSKVAGELPEPNIGLRGSVRVRNGETVKELIAAPDCGYLIIDSI